MTESDRERAVLTADDDHQIHLQIFDPANTATGVIQVLHGLGEYADRYARFADAANQRGLAVCVHDHRGHGPNAEALGFFAEKNGWRRLSSDALIVHEHIRERYSDQPITLLGHSMGSYVAQRFAMYHGARLSALLLSASTWPSRLQVAVGHLLARIECWRLGERRESPLLDKLGFGNFNKRFEPARTKLDWISRDEEEVDLYITNPLCGGPYTAGLWRDLTAGLFEIAADDAVNRVPSDLPILITGGKKDPVGGEKGLGKLALHYAQTGHTRLKVHLYPDGRHEMLNEINRDDVTRDWLDWIVANTHT